MTDLILENIVILWINNPANEKRNIHMKELLNKNFPSNPKYHIPAVNDKVRHKGITMAHTVAILKGIALNKPFIVLEDDVEIFDGANFQKLVEEYQRLAVKPKAIFLGLSICGPNKSPKEIGNKRAGIKGDYIYFKNGALLKKATDHFVKVEKMYSAHSILFVDMAFAEETVNENKKAIANNKPHDVYYVNLQQRHLIYALDDPWFYQSREYRGQEIYTKFRILDIPKI